MKGLRVVYSGALAQQPRNGGLTWFHLQFLLGLRRLGCRVLFVDRLEPEMCRDELGRPCGLRTSANYHFFLRTVRDFGLEGSASLIYDRGREVIGVPLNVIRDFAPSADLLLNVMGYLDDPELRDLVPRRVFIDIDPGFGQMWAELGLHDTFRGHSDFVSMGRNIGRPGCAIPTCGRKWLTMAQPVVLEYWPWQPPNPNGAWTTIGAWRGPNAPVEFDGKTYGLRVHELRKFLGLPALCPDEQFELALEIHPNDERDIRALRSAGWALADPTQVAGDLMAYRHYVTNSKAELMIPKQMYVETASGLLSDRSAYYLATGRPVAARDTGLRGLYPVGLGLVTFTTLEEAAAAIAAITADYDRHARAARAIAIEHFDSDRVFRRLFADLGLAL